MTRSRRHHGAAHKNPYDNAPLAEPCEHCGKKRYPNRKAARSRAKRLTRRAAGDGKPMSTYECNGYWHIGHKPYKVRKGLLARDEFKPRKEAG